MAKNIEKYLNAEKVDISEWEKIASAALKGESLDNLNKEIDKDIKVDDYNFNFSPEDIDIYKKISEWPKCIEISSKKLEPHRVPTYLYELSSLFHSYWNMGKDDKSKRFISEDKKISDEKLVLLKSVSNVIKCGMNLVGASTPEKM